MFDDDFDDFDDGMYDHDGSAHSGGHALELGTGYALFRHGQDRQAGQIIGAIERLGSDLQPGQVDVHVHQDDGDRRGVPVINALDFTTVSLPDSWDDYIGQGPAKRQIAVYMNLAEKKGKALPHTLLASGFPGVGKTMMARMIAKAMGKKIVELVPPFNIYTMVEAAKQLDDGDILFIDEIHKLADSGKRGAEILLKVLEEGVAFMPDGEVVELNDITVIGATTDRDMLPEPVLDRFKIKPYFQAYSDEELARIAIQFAYRHGAQDVVDKWMAAHIALACRGTPRIIEEMIMAADALAATIGRPATPQEVLEFLEVEPDGMTRTHIHYITSLYQYFARTKPKSDDEIEYIVGEAAIQQILRETKQGIGRIERFLVERGLIDRTPRGRRLTDLGIERAREFVDAGKGASDVA